MVAADIFNVNKTFPVAFSYSAECQAEFKLFFKSLNMHAWMDDVLPPRVVLADQASGLSVAMQQHLPDAYIQICE